MCKFFDKGDEIFETKFNDLEQSIERMGVWRINTGECSVNKNNEEIINEVGDSYKNRLTGSSDENIVVVEKVNENNNDIIKNVVLELSLIHI